MTDPTPPHGPLFTPAHVARLLLDADGTYHDGIDADVTVELTPDGARVTLTDGTTGTLGRLFDVTVRPAGDVLVTEHGA